MNPNRLAWAAVAFTVCFFAGGRSIWRGSYVEYLNASLPWGVIALFAGVGIFLAWIIGTGILISAIAVLLAFPAIVMVRVILDGLQDPTSHNLWPFEVVLATILGALIAFPAACVGRLLRFITHRHADGSGPSL